MAWRAGEACADEHDDERAEADDRTERGVESVLSDITGIVIWLD